MNSNLLMIAIIAIVLAVLLLYLLIKSRIKIRSYEKEYRGIIDVDREIQRKVSEINDHRDTINQLREKYQYALDIHEKLSHENNLLQDNLDISEFGIYEPHFEYETSEIFKEKIVEIREEQKAFIRNEQAILGGENWTVNDSIQKGKAMVRRQKKLMLRAFNGECDSFISNVRWNNVKRMEERIDKSMNAINKMGETQRLTITHSYASLKVKELKLTYEYRLKKYEEKEAQREIKARMREEEKAQRDFEKAQKEAEKEERLLLQAMTRAREEIQKSSEEERAKYEAQLTELAEKLRIAEEKNQRAISMAQMTKSGHVYIISNIGSFGENVYKIGMTRRLEPLDRINELGDASVPFKFDVHVMIYSENAPELENQLHKAFERHRMNYVNRRREYFNVSLEEIKKVVHDNHGIIEFIMEPEAKEYRESKIIRKSFHSQDSSKNIETSFPDIADLFK